MTLKTYKPYTKSTRGTILVDKKNIWKGSPFKPLTKGKVSSGGRNNLGRITSRHRGDGHKNKYRIVDFYRKKDDLNAKVERIEYDPNRTSYIALLKYEDNSRNYIICPQNLKKNIEKIFKVNVTKINIVNKKTRIKTTNRGSKKVSGYKKAMITIKKGQNIDLTSGI